MAARKKRRINDKIFWTLIEETRDESKKDLKKQLKLLKKRFVKVPDSELVQYDEALRTWLHRCEIGPLADAMFIMRQYGSDDTFEYWRAALLMHGKKVVQAAIRNPESLADQDRFKECESHLYLVVKELERRYGEHKAWAILDKAKPEIDNNLDWGFQSETAEEERNSTVNF